MTLKRDRQNLTPLLRVTEREDFVGRVALITGGAGWLGLPITMGLARAGATTIMVGRSQSKLLAAQERLKKFGISAFTFASDIGVSGSRTQLLNFVTSEFGVLDVLVNNAHNFGDAVESKETLSSLTKPDFGSAVEAYWNLTRDLMTLLEAGTQKPVAPSVVNISSMYAQTSPRPSIYRNTTIPLNPVEYGAQKAGIEQMTRWLAIQLAGKIRVNSISPGAFPKRNVTLAEPTFEKRLAQQVPMGRIGEPWEIAGPAVFLASQDASYITGANILVDGGWTSW